MFLLPPCWRVIGPDLSAPERWFMDSIFLAISFRVPWSGWGMRCGKEISPKGLQSLSCRYSGSSSEASQAVSSPIKDKRVICGFSCHFIKTWLAASWKWPYSWRWSQGIRLGTSWWKHLFVCGLDAKGLLPQQSQGILSLKPSACKVQLPSHVYCNTYHPLFHSLSTFITYSPFMC